jgi:hypothetical protein
LPYRPDLVGFMSNVKGVGRNIHPFWEMEGFFFFFFFSKQKVLGVFIVMILLIFWGFFISELWFLV